MKEEAKQILDVFYRAGVEVGGFVHFCDFGDAIVWEAGFIRDEPVRQALQMLIDEEYVEEMPAGLRLTKKRSHSNQRFPVTAIGSTASVKTSNRLSTM